jgi:hypothetical protein
MLGVKTLAHKATLHVNKADKNRINRTRANLVFECVEGEHEQPFASEAATFQEVGQIRCAGIVSVCCGHQLDNRIGC